MEIKEKTEIQKVNSNTYNPKGQNRNLQGNQYLTEYNNISSSVLHDLGSPLSVIDIVHNKKRITREDKICVINALKNIRESIERVRQFQSGKILKEYINITDVISNIVNIIKPLLKNNGIAITLNLENNLFILGDKKIFSQIILNIISNAIEALGKKYPPKIVNIFGKRFGKTSFVYFKDNGIGIENDIKNKIFDKDFTTKKNSGGSGLGLYMTKRYIENEFGGKIEFQSKYGKGTTFILILPIHENN